MELVRGGDWEVKLLLLLLLLPIYQRLFFKVCSASGYWRRPWNRSRNQAFFQADSFCCCVNSHSHLTTEHTYNNRHCPANCVKQIKLIKCILPIDFELIVCVCVCVLSVWCTPESWLSCVQWGYAEARRKKVTNLFNFFQTYQVEKKKCSADGLDTYRRAYAYSRRAAIVLSFVKVYFFRSEHPHTHMRILLRMFNCRERRVKKKKEKKSPFLLFFRVCARYRFRFFFFRGGFCFFTHAVKRQRTFFLKRPGWNDDASSHAKTLFLFLKTGKKKQQNSLRCWNIFIRRPRKGKIFYF